jgi:Fic family protein
MKIPSITITPHILKLIVKITSISKLIEAHPVQKPLLRQLDRASILKSSLYSARIEGNPLDELTIDSDDQQAKREIFNLVDAADYVRTLPPRQLLSRTEILRIHTIVMRDIASDAGMLRKEQNAIFDPSGAVRYLPPPPLSMRRDLEKLIRYANTSTEFSLITALITHLFFEKIHPFIDGNGRVGRLLIPFVQKTHGEHFPLVVPFERYLEKHRDQYYRHLETAMQSPGEYLLFMLDGIHEELVQLKKDISALSQKNNDTNFLLLSARQQEIYTLIKEHTCLSINMIHRRFLRIPMRTIRYDIDVLIRKHLICKIGATRGAVYKVI